MKSTVRKIFEILFIIIVVVLSVVIFLNRDKIGRVSDISYLGLFSLCFLANSTVLLPAPSLMIAASCALIMNPLLVALFAALGSTMGEFVGYIFGMAGVSRFELENAGVKVPCLNHLAIPLYITAPE